ANWTEPYRFVSIRISHDRAAGSIGGLLVSSASCAAGGACCSDGLLQSSSRHEGRGQQSLGFRDEEAGHPHTFGKLRVAGALFFISHRKVLEVGSSSEGISRGIETECFSSAWIVRTTHTQVGIDLGVDEMG